jgi:hypothetical protein
MSPSDRQSILDENVNEVEFTRELVEKSTVAKGKGRIKRNANLQVGSPGGSPGHCTLPL